MDNTILSKKILKEKLEILNEKIHFTRTIQELILKDEATPQDETMYAVLKNEIKELRKELGI